jgi:hypothetical protein
MNDKKLARDPFGGKLDKKVKKTITNKNFIHRTVTIKREHLEKIRTKAYWDRTTQKEILYNILESYFKDKNIKPIPGKRI